jgi:hypothetical protein
LAGNVDPTPATYTWTVDGAAPTTSVILSGSQKTCGPDPNPPSGGTCFINSATIILSANEPATILYRVNGGAWQTYTSSFTVTSEGINTVEFYATDTAGNVEPTRSISIKITYLSTAVLDFFNRRDGNLGPDWTGATSGYRIVNRQVDVAAGGEIYWGKAKEFGVDQEAFVTLTAIDANSREHNLMLKVQGGSSPNFLPGAVRVRYDAVAQTLQVATRRSGVLNWVTYPSLAVTFQNGDQIGARVRANGEVWLYRNCLRVGTVILSSSDQSYFNTKGGRIGLWFANAGNAIFDDFGGGTGIP